MAIAIVMPGRDCEGLIRALAAHLDDPVFDASQALSDCERQAVRLAVVWYPPAGFETDYPNLQAVMSYGAGADFLTQGAPLPAELQLGRLIDPHLREQMARYLLSIVLTDHGRLEDYRAQQQQNRWHALDPGGTRRIGFLGRGVLARFAGDRFESLGYQVQYWQRNASKHDTNSMDGPEGLSQLLRQSQVVICLLPLTDQTRGLLDAGFFEQMQCGALLINAGRGAVLNQDDLIKALDRGQFGRAWLDVTDPEPLPSDSRLWQHHRVRITPHIASKTDPASAAVNIVENYRSLLSGSGLLHPVNRQTGY